MLIKIKIFFESFLRPYIDNSQEETVINIFFIILLKIVSDELRNTQVIKMIRYSSRVNNSVNN